MAESRQGAGALKRVDVAEVRQGVEAAYRRVQGDVWKTPLALSHPLSSLSEGARVYLKLGTFRVRAYPGAENLHDRSTCHKIAGLG